MAGCGPKIYIDGTYKGVSTADDRGYAVAEVTVKNDKITEVRLSEFTVFGAEKDLDTYEFEGAKKANEEISKQLVGRQDAAVSVYTGATISSKKYISAVSFALEKAKKNPDIKSVYFDGTFSGKSSIENGGYGVALVTIENDMITKVRLLEFDDKDERRDYPTYSYTPVLQAKEQLERAFVDKNSAEVEGFTGATISSKRWIEAVSDALNAARVR
jgi:uncharacterized protein with FMN-binding domain